MEFSDQMRRCWQLPVACVVALSFFGSVRGDAIVRTQAMLASTIAEYYIQEGQVTVELEIGLSDLEGFRNLLPDAIYEKLGYPPQPLAERLVPFFGEDFTVMANDGPPLPGRILEMVPRDRIERDEITGEPLPRTEEEPETVVFARLEYPLPARPASLTIGGAAPVKGAGIGFVVYHEAIAVNDFRYLSPSQTVELDWEDPWYSKFETRNLRRAYFAPMNGFIYVEPYEVRKEIVLRPKDLQSWIDLGLAGRETIPVEMQDELKRQVAGFLREHHPVLIDGESITPDLAQINFLERTLKTSRVIDPPEELDINSAMLGAIFVYPTTSLPQQVTMEWDLFNERIQMVPASAVDQAGPLPTYLEPDFAVLEWQNFLKNPVLPTLKVLAAPPGRLAHWLALLRWPALLASILLVAWFLSALLRRRERPAAGAAAMACVMILTVACFVIGGRARLSGDRAGEVVSGLLHNVYRAFDFREEEQIYDVLDRSVAGDLLTRIYLETRRGLELANQGGARAKVKEIELIDLETAMGEDGGFLATATWNVTGSVGHWGHVHQRRNQYRAQLGITPIDGAWKLTRIEILEEERL
jgi:hypothetical protein